MDVVYEKQAIKTLMKMPRKTAVQIREKCAVFALRSGKMNVDIETLKGVRGGYRLRQGDWRVLMLVEGQIVRIVTIQPRGDAYK